MLSSKKCSWSSYAIVPLSSVWVSSLYSSKILVSAKSSYGPCLFRASSNIAALSRSRELLVKACYDILFKLGPSFRKDRFTCDGDAKDGRLSKDYSPPDKDSVCWDSGIAMDGLTTSPEASCVYGSSTDFPTSSIGAYFFCGVVVVFYRDLLLAPAHSGILTSDCYPSVYILCSLWSLCRFISTVLKLPPLNMESCRDCGITSLSILEATLLESGRCASGFLPFRHVLPITDISMYKSN